jgi:succinate dehydrogenase / fumarate reductase cytochrome b subunit
MGTNILMRVLEIGLVVGFLVHIIDGLNLYFENRSSRPQGYAVSNASKNSSWYSRSMALLGTLILMFLILHTSDFWIPNRYSQFTTGEEINLFDKMKLEFQELWVVILYVLACISLAYHLLHGFQSAFQSLGVNHYKYNRWICAVGWIFSILIPLLFALMPIAFYFGIIK